MKRPLLAVALLYAAGIAAWNRVDPPAASAIPLAALLSLGLALALAALLLPRTRPCLLALLLPVTGAANLARTRTLVSPHDLRHLVTENPILATVHGSLRETPSLREWDPGPEAEPVRRTLAILQVDSLQRKGQPPVPAHGTVVVTTPGELPPELWGGRQVQVEGVLRTPAGPQVPGQFDYRAFLARQGIHFQLVTTGRQDWRLDPGPDPAPAPPLADRFTDWGRALLARGLPEDQSLRLLWAMTLGWKTALNQDNTRPFMQSGTLHVFAISGLHVALIGGVLVLILRALRVPSDAAAWMVIPALWFYTHATGWQASAIRSTLMLTVVLAGGALRRPSDLLNSLFVAALVILLWDPRQLFQAGFQLSFSVVLFLALGWPGPRPRATPGPDAAPGGESRLHQLARQLPLLGRCLHDPLQPASLRPRWRRALDRPARALGQALLTSLTAWLGSLPLTAHYFNLLTPVSLVSNLVVVPLSSIALAANLASLGVGAFLPRAAELFNHAAWAAMHLMVRFSEWTAAWPGAWTSVQSPGWAFCLLYYAALLSLLTGCFRHPRWRRWNAAGLALLCLLWAVPAGLARPVSRLTLLPAGGGQALCVEGAGTPDPLLVDCGDEHSAERLVLPFLRSRGLDHIHTLVLTHGDIRHVGGADRLRQTVRVHHLAASPVPFRSAAYREAHAGAADAVLRRGDRLGPWSVLHPAEGDRFPQADDNALVLHGTLQGTRVLLLSDLGKPGQGALLARQTNLLADVVIAGLPAQGEPLAEALLDAVRPSLIVLVDSLFPATARASARLRERLAARGVPVLCTSETGGLSIELQGPHWHVRNSEGRVVAEKAPL